MTLGIEGAPNDRIAAAGTRHLRGSTIAHLDDALAILTAIESLDLPDIRLYSLIRQNVDRLEEKMRSQFAIIEFWIA